jgi:hypothetical protein
MQLINTLQLSQTYFSKKSCMKKQMVQLHDSKQGLCGSTSQEGGWAKDPWQSLKNCARNNIDNGFFL